MKGHLGSAKDLIVTIIYRKFTMPPSQLEKGPLLQEAFISTHGKDQMSQTKC